MLDIMETRYFRQSHDNDQTWRVWRLQPGRSGEWWDAHEHRWNERDERFDHGLRYWLYADPSIDLDTITQAEADIYIAGLNRGLQLTAVEVARQLREE
jgi:hypothetical protein